MDKEKLGLRSSEKLIHYQESQFMKCIGVEEAPPPSSSSLPKSNEEKATIEETPNKLKALRTKSVPRNIYPNFQQLARWM